MANIKYLRCAKCGCDATPHKATWENGQLVKEAEVGTGTLMRCRDCSTEPKDHLGKGYATMCRDCCPTGHGTRWNQPEAI